MTRLKVYKRKRGAIKLQTIMDLFQTTAVVSPQRQFVVKHPITPLREYSPIEFLIENNGHAFIDLRQTRLQVKCKIIKSNGEALWIRQTLY